MSMKRSLIVIAVILASGLLGGSAVAERSGSITVSTEPAALTVPQCLAGSVQLRLENASPQLEYLELTIDADPPLQVSRDALATVLPGGYSQSLPIRVAVPHDAAPGRYELRIRPRGPQQFEPLSVPVTVPAGSCVPREEMTATATSANTDPDYGPRFAIDGVETTIWHTQYTPVKSTLPQSITLALDRPYDLTGLAYQPRLEGGLNGTITAYNIAVSADGEEFTRVASGTWTQDTLLKNATFSALDARYVRLEATAGRGNYASAAEIVLFGRPDAGGGCGHDPSTTATCGQADVGGTVPPTLSLSLGAPATFEAFQPGVEREYLASTTASVVSSAGDAALGVSEPGHLANGGFSLPQPLEVAIEPGSWDRPVSNAESTITFRQRIGASDALRTGAYTRTLTFTLSTTSP
jgi:hypothetical protein